jgi:hypothetical protein
MLQNLVDEPEVQRLLRAHKLVAVQRGLNHVICPPLNIGQLLVENAFILL